MTPVEHDRAFEADEVTSQLELRRLRRGQAADDREHAAADRDDDAAGRDNAPASTDQRRFTPEHEASISVGFAELHPEENLEKLMTRADLALYEEKRSVR